MEIVAAEPAGDVDRLADGVEAGDLAGLHGLRGEAGGGDSADGDLGLGEAFGAVRGEAPLRQAALGFLELAVGEVGELAGEREAFGQGLGEAFGKVAGEHRLERRRAGFARFASRSQPGSESGRKSIAIGSPGRQ